jgi:hypothetical protein
MITHHCKYRANIHSGLDQVTPLLRSGLNGSNFAVFNIFDPEQMTEPSSGAPVSRAVALSQLTR